MLASVVIVGGGLAGIAAAVRLAEAGVVVHLVEAGPALGGRARVHAGVGPLITGGCTNLLDLLDRLELLESIIWIPSLTCLIGQGESRSVRPGRAMPPFHARALLQGLSSNRAQLRDVKRAFWRLVRMSPSARFDLREESAVAWLESMAQSEDSIRTIWQPWCEALIGRSLAMISADQFIQVLQEGVLPQRFGGALGEWIAPEKVLRERLHQRISRAQGTVRLNCPVRAITYDGQRVRGVVTDSESIDATFTIVATPPVELQRLTSDTLKKADVRLRTIASSREVRWRAASMTLPRRTLAATRALCVDEDIRWIVDAEPWRRGEESEGQRLTFVLTQNADALRATKGIRDIIRSALDRLLPASRGLDLANVAEHDLCRTMTAIDSRGNITRPLAAARTAGLHGAGPANLLFAGDWIETDWPESLESAVRSGYTAAGAILGKDLVIGTLPPTLLGQFLGLRPGGRIAY